MDMIKEINGVKGYYRKNGQVFLNLKDVSIKIGIINSHNNTIRWARVKEMINAIMESSPNDSLCLVDFNGYQGIGPNTYISQELAYLLAMNAKNDKAFQFQYELATVLIPKFIDDNPDYLPQSEIMSDIQKFRNAIENDDPISLYIKSLSNAYRRPISIIIHDMVNEIYKRYNINIRDIQIKYSKKVNGQIRPVSAMDIINIDSSLQNIAMNVLEYIDGEYSGRNRSSDALRIEQLQNEIDIYKSQRNGSTINIAHRPSTTFNNN